MHSPQQRLLALGIWPPVVDPDRGTPLVLEEVHLHCVVPGGEVDRPADSLDRMKALVRDHHRPIDPDMRPVIRRGRKRVGPGFRNVHEAGPLSDEFVEPRFEPECYVVAVADDAGDVRDGHRQVPHLFRELDVVVLVFDRVAVHLRVEKEPPNESRKRHDPVNFRQSGRGRGRCRGVVLPPEKLLLPAGVWPRVLDRDRGTPLVFEEVHAHCVVPGVELDSVLDGFDRMEALVRDHQRSIDPDVRPVIGA
mmetsp:Transcript_3928/g.9401  ORF Transcript_3928/g.9401 Transcript_3928/m.9401 type:complete len:250 (+) Transcript_3928:352-1101(+)